MVPSPPAHEKPEVHSWEHANFVLTEIAHADAFAKMRMQLPFGERLLVRPDARATGLSAKQRRARSSAAAAGFSKGYPLGARYM